MGSCIDLKLKVTQSHSFDFRLLLFGRKSWKWLSDLKVDILIAINKHLKVMITWVISDEMIYHYFNGIQAVFVDSIRNIPQNRHRLKSWLFYILRPQTDNQRVGFWHKFDLMNDPISMVGNIFPLFSEVGFQFVQGKCMISNFV